MLLTCSGREEVHRMSIFGSIWNAIKKVVRKLIPSKELKKVLGKELIGLNDDMQKAIKLWGEMYTNRAPWLSDAETPHKSLNIAATIANEKARLATIEMEINVAGSDKKNSYAEYLDKQFAFVKNRLRKQLEYGIALGGLIIKPYVKSLEDKRIYFEFVQADCFYPISFGDSEQITEAVFVDTKTIRDILYTKLEIQRVLDNGTLEIQNLCFSKQASSTRDDDLGQQTSLINVPEWANLAPSAIVGSPEAKLEELLFAYYSNPEANTIDPHSPLGVSGYSRAKDLIQDAERQYARLDWEFEAGETALDIDKTATITYIDEWGNKKLKLPKGKNRLFRKIDMGLANNDPYHIYNPTLRDVSQLNLLNTQFVKIEDLVGLSRGVLSFMPEAESRTATELKILKQRTYSTISDIQKSLQDTIERLFKVMDIFVSIYDLAPREEYELSFKWDDSIIVDNSEKFKELIILVDKGVMTKEEMRMWYFGESEKEAAKKIKEIREAEPSLSALMGGGFGDDG